MRRLAFILLALAWCASAFAQAFTPRRPFVFQSTAAPNNDPTNIPGLYMWFKSASFTNDGPINLWTDVISGIVFTQTLAALQPMKTNDGIWFTGTRNFMTNDVAKVAGYHYVIFKRDANGGQNTYAASITPITDVNYALYHVSVPTGSYWYRCLNACANEYLSSETYTNQMSDFYSGAQEYTNGVLATAFGGPLPTIVLGGIGGGATLDCFHGYLYDLFIFTNDLSAANVATMHYYATNTYWNLYQNYLAPVFAGTLTNFSCDAYSVINLSLTLSQGNPTPVYQWQTNSVNVADGTMWAGTTNLSLWITNSSIQFSNLSLRCIASNLMGMATSSVAVMNVRDYTNGLVLFWKFDDGSGTSAADSSGYANTGTLFSNPAWATTPSHSGGSLFFNGACWVVKSNATLVPTGNADRTYSIWFYATNNDVGANHFAMSSGYPNNNTSFLVGLGAMRFLVSTAGAANDCISAPGVVASINTWYNIVGTYSGGIESIYTNGVFCVSKDITSTSTSDSNTYAGKHAAGEFWRGFLDDMRVWNRLLTTNEIGVLPQWRPSQ